MAEAMICGVCFVGLPFGFAQDKKAHAFTGTATAEGVAPTALGIRRLCFPALPGGANLCRAYGAPIHEPGLPHGLLPFTLSPERRDPSARRYCATRSGLRLFFRARGNSWRGDARRSTDRSVCATKNHSIVKERCGARRESRGARSARLISRARSISQAPLAVDTGSPVRVASGALSRSTLGALSSLPDSTRRRHWEPCHGGQKL